MATPRSPDPPAELQQHLRAALAAVGLDLHDPEALGTPERVAVLWWEQWSGLRTPVPTLSLLEAPRGAAGASEPVVIAAVPFRSACLHHLTPVVGTMDFAYAPGAHLVGVGEPGRLLAHFAAAPTLQERLTEAVVQAFTSQVRPQGVLVRLRAHHTCLQVRGSRSGGVVETVAAVGTLQQGPLRAEVFGRLHRRDPGGPVVGADG